MPFPEYENHPPQNRDAVGIDMPWFEITDAEKTFRTTPNALVGCVIWGATGEQPRDPQGNVIEALDDGAAIVFNPLDLVARDNIPSLLSDQPSVQLRMEDMSVDLTPEELLRLIARELTVDEYTSLRDHFGMFYDIHADFYDARTGRSLHTMRSLWGDNPAAALRPERADRHREPRM
ncbi:hypothetical protein [Rhizobium sp. BK176]|uniref:hypothetical protein n=1 Tax=Rhizobium sp. BK176 TaxID=2587071 RepID=UPI002167B4B5|nr:hypothetical protein [Rhizobium sp. BK176]MCS4089070.1 hypothetical protein [Rhizobium sp. BK176]